MDTWVTGGRVADMRSISTSTVNIDACSTIARVIVDGILKYFYNYTIHTKMIKSNIAREIVDGLLRPRSPFTSVTTMINSTTVR